MVEKNEIKGFEIFSAFSEEQLEEILKLTEKKSYEKGAKVYNRGDKADRIYVVTNGMVSLRRIDPGEDVGISFEKRQTGELFGAACFMEPREYTLTAICLEDSEVVAIDAEKLFQLCERNFEIGYKFIKEVARIYFERYKIAKNQIHQMVKEPTIITALPG